MIVSGFVADRFGRKWPAVVFALICCAGTATQYVAHTRADLLGGKIIMGFGIGASYAIATTYASEVCTPGFL